MRTALSESTSHWSAGALQLPAQPLSTTLLGVKSSCNLRLPLQCPLTSARCSSMPCHSAVTASFVCLSRSSVGTVLSSAVTCAAPKALARSGLQPVSSLGVSAGRKQDRRMHATTVSSGRTTHARSPRSQHDAAWANPAHRWSAQADCVLLCVSLPLQQVFAKARPSDPCCSCALPCRALPCCTLPEGSWCTQRCGLSCPASPMVSLKGCSSTRLRVLYFCALALLAVLRLAPLGGGKG